MTGNISSEPLVAEDAYAVLGLRPSAPQELVVEVYWDSVHRLRGDIDADAGRGQAIALLNGAYATIGGGTNGTWSEGIVRPDNMAVDTTAASGKRTLFQRLLGRDSEDVRLNDDCWQVLSVAPSATPEVLDLAYRFWSRRIRGQVGDAAANAEEQLRDAYDVAQGYVTDSPDAPEDRPGSTEESEPAEDLSDADEGREREDVPVSSADAPRKEPSRLTTAISASASATSRWAAAVRHATREWLKVWAANPLHERVSQQPLPDPTLLKERQQRANAPLKPEPRTVKGPEMEPDPGVTTPVIEGERLPQRKESVGPRLVTPRGDIVPISSQALTIGSDPTCDIVARGLGPESKHVSAHVWAEESRVVLHVVGEDPAVRVNGVAAVWAFLENGDELTVGNESYRYEAPDSTDKRSADELQRD